MGNPGESVAAPNGCYTGPWLARNVCLFWGLTKKSAELSIA